jgi:UDP-N-acetylmuramyl pentapeptide phosphotransferase/UDP-N-acetylglucosamine-1-phosphate transferase
MLTSSLPLTCIAAIIALAAAAGCALILGLLLRTGLAWRIATDVPNHRSLHTRPTPRIGGWGIVPVVALAFALRAPSLWLIAACVVCVALVSQFDDRRGLPARVRFAAHLAAVLAVIVVYPASVPWWALAVLALLMLWFINLFNFMDGANGLAGGMALSGFAAYGIAASSGPHAMPELACASAAVAGAGAGFLCYNFQPARLFLGDAGSISLGLLAGALGYWGWRGAVWPVWFPALVFAPFIADASATLLRRVARGEKFWHAHREHYYQRMIRMDTGHASHTRVVLAWYGVMLAGVMLALWARQRSIITQWASVAAWAGVLIVMGTGIDRRWQRFLCAHAAHAGDVVDAVDAVNAVNAVNAINPVCSNPSDIHHADVS